jgi:hypothetical protein
MNRIRLRATCYIDDCPPGCGGLHIWPRSHHSVWARWQVAMGGGAIKTPLSICY